MTWDHDEQEIDLQRMSRNSTPENDFVDVEGTDRPPSAASTSSQKATTIITTNTTITATTTTTSNIAVMTPPTGPPIIPAMPEIKRGRGRPRKLPKDHIEEGEFKLQHEKISFFCLSIYLLFFLCFNV